MIRESSQKKEMTKRGIGEIKEGARNNLILCISSKADACAYMCSRGQRNLWTLEEVDLRVNVT